MDLTFVCLKYGLLCLIVLCIFTFYRNYKKKVEGFPYFRCVSKVVYDQMMGKIPKDTPFTSYIFHTLVDICKQFANEGLVMTFFDRPALIIFSEDAMKFFSNEKAALDKSPEYELLQVATRAGILTSNGERWKTHRKIVNRAFNIRTLKSKFPLYNSHASALVMEMKKLADKTSINLFDLLKSHYCNVLSESVFGIQQNEENREEILKCFEMIESLLGLVVTRFIRPWLRPDFFFSISPTGRKFRHIMKEYNCFLTKLVNDMKKKFASMKPGDTDRFGNDLQESLTYILLSQHLNDPSFTSEDVMDEVSTIFIAGWETTVVTTLWCLFLLGLHPEVQEKVFNEVQSVTDSDITYEDSCNLTYLEAVMMETLRLFPSAPIFARNLSEDVQYDKYKVHKGTTIFFVPYMSHRNPDRYINPEKFEPERFLGAASTRSWSFVPFSEGSRSCIGKKLALMEIKIFLAHILKNFKITSLDKREDISLCWSISLTPARHIRMQITPRNTADRLEKSVCDFSNTEGEVTLQMSSI